MGSIGSMTKPENGFLTAAIQYPVPVVNSRKDIDYHVNNIIKMIKKLKLVTLV